MSVKTFNKFVISSLINEYLGEAVAIKLIYAGVNNWVYKVSVSRGLKHGRKKFALRLLTEASNLTMSHISNQGRSICQIAGRMASFASSGYAAHPIAVLLPRNDENQDLDLEDLPAGVDIINSNLSQAGILVEYIEGRQASLPQDLSLLMHTLLQLHGSDNSRYTKLKSVHKSDTALKLPIMRDANPGNFLVSGHKELNMRAVAIDIEGQWYGLPTEDLTHLSMYPAILWSQPYAEPLSPIEIANLYKQYKKEYVEIIDSDTNIDSLFAPNSLQEERSRIMSRVFAWMERLIILTKQNKINPPDSMLDRAHNILSASNRQKTARNESELNQLLHTC